MTQQISTSSRDESADMALRELLSSLGPRTKVILPTDDNYNASKRIWNAMYDSKKPAIIVQVTGVGDVQACIKYAHKVSIAVTPRGGGHSWPGFSTIEGGLVIDFALMRSVQVNPTTKEVVVEPGVLLGELDHETQVFGLATPVGVISHTGVFGLVLGGGVGWLCRKYGASVDNIISANIVLADGRFVTASDNQNQDLFWGIRGAAQNFGIVTSLTLKAHPVALAYRGTYLYPMDQISDVLHVINNFMQTAPREFNCEIYNRGRIDGSWNMYLKVCYSFYMPKKEAESAADPLKSIGKPTEASWDWITHVRNQKIFDTESPHHRRYYAKSGSINFHNVNARFIDAFRRGVETVTSPYHMVEMIGLGGAMKDCKADHSAFFSLRSQDWLVNVVASWNNDIDEEISQAQIDSLDKEHIDWCQKTFLDLSTNMPGYINMMADSTQETQSERLTRSFEPNLEQLRALKKRYDPQNFFRHNVNIPPAVDAVSSRKTIEDQPEIPEYRRSRHPLSKIAAV